MRHIFLLLALLAGLAWTSVPPFPKATSPKPSLLRPRAAANVRAAVAPRFTITRIMVIFPDGVPSGARGFTMDIFTNEWGVMPNGYETIIYDPIVPFQVVITNEFRNRPERFWFSMATIGETNNSGYIQFHWPPFSKTFIGVALSWNANIPVKIETSTDLWTWQTLTNLTADHFDHIPENAGDHLFYRLEADRVLTLGCSAIMKPDARDDY